MTLTQSTRPQPLTPALLKELASQQGPCTTFLIQGTTGGRENGSRAATLRGLLRSTPASLLGPDVLRPVEDFVARFEDEAGGPGIALFRSPGFFFAAAVPGLDTSAVLRGKSPLAPPRLRLRTTACAANSF